MAYIPEVGGYIADVPRIDFLRSDGDWYSWDEASTSSMTNNANTITINGGWSKSPLAVIDTESSIELVFESAKFTPEIFAAANSATVEVVDTPVFETDIFEVKTGLTFKIPHAVDVSRVKIKGFTYTSSSLAAGKFTAVVGTSPNDDETTITFNTGDVAVGDVIRVGYYRILSDATTVTVKTTNPTAVGEVWVRYPIFSSSDNGGSGALLGILHMHLYRVRVSALPGFNSSYKTAGTNGMTFAALDPKRADKKFFMLKLEKFDASGNSIPSTDVGDGSTDWTE